MSAPEDWVLAVDDEAPMCRLIADIISHEQVEVVAASDGAAALRVIQGRKTEPLLVIADVLMPGLDGLTLARKLTPLLKRTKIALISGHLSEDSWWPVDLRELAFLAKPFPAAALVELVHTARSERHQIS